MARSDAAWTTIVAVKPNTFYRLSGWIRTDRVQGAVGALLNIQNMQEVKTRALRGTKGWAEVNCLFGGLLFRDNVGMQRPHSLNFINIRLRCWRSFSTGSVHSKPRKG